MTLVNLDNNIITETIDANTTFIVPEGGFFTPTSGPTQSDTSESYEAFNKNLGTNGFAFAEDVGVIDLSDLSLVLETNFTQTPPDNTVLTDSGFIVNARDTGLTGGSTDVKITFEFYDLNQTNPTKQSNTFSNNPIDSSFDETPQVENLGYARPSQSSVILQRFGTDSTANADQTRILMYDFLSGDNAALEPNYNKSGSAEMRFAKRESGWSYGIDDGSSLNIVGGTGFIDLSAGDSLDFQKSQNSTGTIGAYDYGAIFTEGSQLQTQDISPTGIAGNALIILWSGSVTPREGDYAYVNVDGTDVWIDGDDLIDANGDGYEAQRLFDTGTAVSGPGIDGIHTFSGRSAKRVSESVINPGEVSVYKLRINEATSSSVTINGAPVTGSSGNFNRVETFVSAGDEIATGASKTHVSLIDVQ